MRTGKSRAICLKPRHLPPRNPTPNGGKRASRARRKSTPRSRRAPTSNISTTSPTSTILASASPGPFTVESLSPHRVLPASEEELIDEIDAAEGRRFPADADLAGQDFAAIVIDYLKAEGVKQQAKGDRITFESLTPWPGAFVGASGTFVEGEMAPSAAPRS